jgi:divalent metal cation (Fe/Co/Zn/Cd) transporter
MPPLFLALARERLSADLRETGPKLCDGWQAQWATFLREAYLGFLHPKSWERPLQGLALNGTASLINALWSSILIRSGHRQRSPALVADGRHLLTDVFTSAGVLVGVGVAAITGWAILDPLIAALVAFNILWMG